MTEQRLVTFVCTGNTCRSPMAEVIARAMISDRGLRGIVVGSAGVFAAPGRPASDGARWAASEAGLDLDGHASSPLTEELVRASHLILTMGSSHLAAVEELGGLGRAHRLKDFAGQDGDVLDPFGAPDQVYRATFDEIRSLVEKAMDRLAAEGP